MFSKTADPTAAPAPPMSPAPPSRPSSGGNASRSVLGPDLRITGEVSCSGAVEVQGEIDGNVSAETLTIGNEGRISGSVSAQSVEVKGQLDGKVASDAFTMRASARVAADVSYTTLVIESGAQIEGRFSRAKA